MQYEFRMAHLDALRAQHRQKLVFVLLGPTSAAQLDADLYQWLKVCPCVHWGDKMFWPRLRFALPELACSQLSSQPTQYLRYQTLAQAASGNHSGSAQGATGSAGAASKPSALARSVVGLLSSALGSTSSSSAAAAARAGANRHQLNRRPLPAPLASPMEAHVYAHLAPEVAGEQSTTGGSSAGRIYQQPIYNETGAADLSQSSMAQQQQQQPTGEPVHI